MHVISVRDADGRWQKAMVLVPVADLLNTDGVNVCCLPCVVSHLKTNVDCRTTSEGYGMPQFFGCFTSSHVSAGSEVLACAKCLPQHDSC